MVPGALVGGEVPLLVGEEAPGELSRVVGARPSSLVVGDRAPLPEWYELCTPAPPDWYEVWTPPRPCVGKSPPELCVEKSPPELCVGWSPPELCALPKLVEFLPASFAIGGPGKT